MQPHKMQTVHNYLTPKKILTSLLNPTHKSTINRSLTEQINNANVIDSHLSVQSSTPRRQRESYKKKYDAQAASVGMGSQQGQDRDPSAKNFILEQKQEPPMYEPHPRKFSQNVDFIRVHNQNNGISSRISRNSVHSREQVTQNPPSSVYESKPIRSNPIPINDPTSAFNFNVNNPQQNMTVSSRKFNVPNNNNINKINPQISKLAIQDTINKLVLVKNTLQVEISQLKKLLDETQSSLNNMDAEFEQLKQKIITYTSKALDSAYREYKKNLPNWAIYENVQQSGINKIAQINQAIELCEHEQKLKAYGGKQAVQRKVQQYRQFVQEVKDARKDCLAQRPVITEDKVRKLEAVLKEIGQF